MGTHHAREAWPFSTPPGHVVRKIQGVAITLYGVAFVLYLTDRTSLGTWFTGAGVVLFLGAAIWTYRHRHQLRSTESRENPDSS